MWEPWYRTLFRALLCAILGAGSLGIGVYVVTKSDGYLKVFGLFLAMIGALLFLFGFGGVILGWMRIFDEI